jgi:nucleoside-triphosphatase THEP1
MLNIVTGRINSSKTTKITEIYNLTKKGDGFVSIKKMNNDLVHSYDVLRLATNERRRLVIRDIYSDDKEEVCCQIGPYLFSTKIVGYIEDTIRELITNKVSPLFLDEVGLLELENLCFHNIFTEMLDSGLDVFVTIRKDLLEKMIEKYKIKEYNLIDVD